MGCHHALIARWLYVAVGDCVEGPQLPIISSPSLLYVSHSTPPVSLDTLITFTLPCALPAHLTRRSCTRVHLRNSRNCVNSGCSSTRPTRGRPARPPAARHLAWLLRFVQSSRTRCVHGLPPRAITCGTQQLQQRRWGGHHASDATRALTKCIQTTSCEILHQAAACS